MRLPGNNTTVRSIAISFIALLLLLPSIWLLSDSTFLHRRKAWPIPQADLQTTQLPSHRRPTIPNIVHYAYLMEDVNGDLNLKFEDFLSVYSSLLYLDPEQIFIHTDASPQSLERAKASTNVQNKWTKKIFELPKVVVRHGTAPTHANNGEKIRNLANRSDFLRAQVVHEFGGMYFDFDVFPLRDFKPFREAGFANVVGLEKYDNVNTGCYMSVKGSELMRVWLKHEHIVYDGGWITHAVTLLTKIVRRIHRIPYEVLILDKDTWAPISWEVEDASNLFSSHPDTSLDSSKLNTDPEGQDIDGALDQERKLTTSDLESLFETDAKLSEWQRDWSATYAIHAFKSDPGKIDNWDGYSVKYVLSRKSNLARALYPALTHAIEAGYLSRDD